MSEEQELRIEEIEEEIAELESRLEDSDNEEIQQKIDELESEKDSIEPEIGSPTEEMIEEKIEDLLEDVRRDPIRALNDFGIDNYDNFINENDFIDGVVDADGIGIINGHDGSYDTVYVNGEEFYVMQIG